MARILNSADIAAAGGLLASSIGGVEATIAASVAQTALAATATTNANTAATTATAAAAYAIATADAAAADATASADAADLITAAAEAFLESVTGQEIVQISGTRVLTAADNGKLIAFTGAGPGLVYADTGLPNSFRVELMKAGTGDLFALAGPGATLGAPADKTTITTRYATAWLRRITDDTLVLTEGDSTPDPLSVNRPIFNTPLASGLALAWFV